MKVVIEKRVEKEIIKEKLTTIRHYISGRERQEEKNASVSKQSKRNGGIIIRKNEV